MGTQVCIRCCIEKPLTDFYAHPRMANGRLGRCKVCHRTEVNRVRNENIDRYRAYDRERAKTDVRKTAYIEKQRRMNAEIPGYTSSHKAVSRAVRNGSLVRPESCSRCPSTNRIQAHHDDHLKPLDVMWLCPVCHAIRHRELGRLRTVEKTSVLMN